MAIFLAYEGEPSDPSQQFVRMVEAEDEDGARAQRPRAFLIQAYEPPFTQDEPDWRKLSRGCRVMDLF